jgi:hypothetical protein
MPHQRHLKTIRIEVTMQSIGVLTIIIVAAKPIHSPKWHLTFKSERIIRQ